jgi:RNA polymerase sigma-70 factor (sigma-E family)
MAAAAVAPPAVLTQASTAPGGSFAQYVARRHQPLLRTAYLLTGNRHDAEDLVQTTLAKTYLAWDRIREPSAVDAYVRRAMVNTSRSGWRRRRVTEVLNGDVPERAYEPITPESTELHEALWQLLGTLPHRQRAVLVLRYYEDLSEPETARVLGISVGTVKSTASRALARLRAQAGVVPPAGTETEGAGT